MLGRDVMGVHGAIYRRTDGVDFTPRRRGARGAGHSDPDSKREGLSQGGPRTLTQVTQRPAAATPLPSLLHPCPHPPLLANTLHCLPSPGTLHCNYSFDCLENSSLAVFRSHLEVHLVREVLPYCSMKLGTFGLGRAQPQRRGTSP